MVGQRTLGLDREQLRMSREEKAERIHALVRRLAWVNEDRLEETLSDILTMGHPERQHAGRVRAVFEQETGLEWSTLEESKAGDL